MFSRVACNATPASHLWYVNTCAGVRSVQPECDRSIATWNFRNFKPEFLLKGKRPKFCYPWCSAINTLLRDTGWRTFEILKVVREIESCGISFLPAVFQASTRRKQVSKYLVIKYASRKIMNFFLPPPLHLYNKFICFTSIVDGPFLLPSVTQNQATANV